MRSRKRHVVGVFGGLGNQLFQYSWAKHLTRESGLVSKLDTSALRSGPRQLELGGLGLQVGPSQLKGMRYVPFVGGRFDRFGHAARRIIGPTTIMREGQPAVLLGGLNEPSWWYGYWQSREVVLGVLAGVRAEVREPIPVGNTIGVHVRRSDFVALGLELTAEYYCSAVRRLHQAHPSVSSVVVFSDDPSWCAENLHFDLRTTIAQGGSASDDLLALAGHEYLVLSRGTFGWWAAHLQDRAAQSVVYPVPYVPGSPEAARLLIDPDWIALSVE